MLWVLIALLIFIFQMATILLLEFRHPSKAVAWMFILFCCPLIGFAVYYFVAQDYKKRRQVRTRGSKLFREIRSTLRSQANRVNNVRDMHGKDFQHQQRLFNLLNRLSENPITGCNRSEVLTDGEAAFGAMLEAMEQAKDHIHIEFYIFRNDIIGTQFQEVMIRKAKAGLKIRFICDGLGSYA
ncbi:cardiolipin synthetase [Paenibacillus pini JCM 16418]|uniref:Cardiolipin synthetase n=1 Tax=Paenibacillus pini JCM 16418 TaxID=1236976 RepID=W7YB84_9BACL|nr:cardiolipin synthetase [Paenibacillus pini JCM 16418]